MSQDPKPNKVEEESPQPKPKKPPGYRNFEKVLKQVIKAPPMRTNKGHVESPKASVL